MKAKRKIGNAEMMSRTLTFTAQKNPTAVVRCKFSRKCGEMQVWGWQWRAATVGRHYTRRHIVGGRVGG